MHDPHTLPDAQRSPLAPGVPEQGTPVAFVEQGDGVRSRSIGSRICVGTLSISAPPARLQADWSRDAAQQLGLEPGDVEPLSLPRARMRWPQYGHCVEAVAQWAKAQGVEGIGLSKVIDAQGDAARGGQDCSVGAGLHARADVALMACRGARYHHDGVQYGGLAFCNVFLSEDQGLDLLFPGVGLRLALQRGTVVLFDTFQPHAVVARGSSTFDVADFGPERDCTVFLSWELPMDNPAVAHAIQVRWDIDSLQAAQVQAPQVQLGGAPVQMCTQTGFWRRG